MSTPLAREVLDAVHDTIRRHKVTYDEYNALKAWLINVGQDGEWPLFLDVWVEHVVEDVATDHREGNKGSIEGPYYVPAAPEQGAVGTIPMRDGEAGTPLVWEGRISRPDGKPLAGKVELWHADADGFYSQFAPGMPRVEPARQLLDRTRRQLRDHHDSPGALPDPDRRVVRQADLRGRLARLASGPPAREGVGAGHELLTAQLYFPGDPHNDDDIASAVKPELMLGPADPAGRLASRSPTTSCSIPSGADVLFHVRMDVRLPADLDAQTARRARRPGEGLLAGTATERQMAAHLAHRRRVRQLLDLRRRIQ